MQISIDDAARRIIESVSETSSTMLQKVSDHDVSSYQSYTIRRLDRKDPNVPDTDQYKQRQRGYTEQQIETLGCYVLSHSFSEWEVWRGTPA